MRLFFLLLLAMPCSVFAQTFPKGADRTYPSLWAPLLNKLPKTQVDLMQASANRYCLSLDYSVAFELYSDVSDCTLMQATAIMTVDVALSGFDLDPATEHRPRQVKKCWAIYQALGGRDVENLANCFGDIQHFELLQRVARPRPSASAASSYCDKVAQAAGGSYMILEECIKQESASRRRLGR